MTRVALVTGAARGIGAAVAAALAADGCAVALLDLDEAVVATATALAEKGYVTTALVGDVGDAAAIESSVARAESELGPITVLANVAGVLRAGTVLDADDTDLATCLSVNAVGVWNTGRAVGRRMRDRRAGAIVTVASNSATTPRLDLAAYGASKAAAVLITQSLGLELAPAGVRCNVVCPGSTDTAMLAATGGDRAGLLAGAPDRWRLGIPLGRIAEPADIADVVVFLAGDRARHITCQSITVDGGATPGA